jgi:hypothetical protein
MKHTLLLFATLLFVATVLYSCSQKNAETENNTATTDTTQANNISKQDTVKGNFIDPNEPSALAALMREMFTEAEAMQSFVKENKIPKDVRTKFAAMQTATPTEKEMTEEPFGSMAKVFLKTMDNLYDEKNQVEDYNLMIQSCLACHQNPCPGPMVRIKKLLIQ